MATIKLLMKNIPAMIKRIPLIIPIFQKNIKEINKIKAGRLCINRPLIICQKVNPTTKTSREKTIKNKTKIMPKILGDQYKNLFIN